MQCEEMNCAMLVADEGFEIRCQPLLPVAEVVVALLGVGPVASCICRLRLASVLLVLQVFFFAVRRARFFEGLWRCGKANRAAVLQCGRGVLVPAIFLGRVLC